MPEPGVRADGDARIFDDLRRAAAPYLPLGPLQPQRYATAHALFEARSDQRARLIDWLVGFASAYARPTPGLRVLSIGCGDGSVDAEFARALAEIGPLAYTGIEPHAPSGALFLSRLVAVPGVTATVETVDFEGWTSDDGYDVILAVHSLYYVGSLASALNRARASLAPGGVLVVIHAPRGRLNRFVAELAPGRVQEFADGVAHQLDATGWVSSRTPLAATLDLSPDDIPEWKDIVDFTVQAEVPEALLSAVFTALQAIALPDTDGRLLVAHPVDIFVATEGSRAGSVP